MRSRQTLELHFTSDPSELPRVRDAITDWAKVFHWTKERVADIVLAVDEALTNVIRHGYEGKPGQPIVLRCVPVDDAQRGRGAEIEIRDWGRQVPLQQICGRDLDDLRPGGLGVHLIRNLMDCAEYSHAEGGGMRLRMRIFHDSPRRGSERSGAT